MTGDGAGAGSLKTPDEPALYITTQTTIPILTTLMFGLSLGILALAAGKDWPTGQLPSWAFHLQSKDTSLVLLGLASLLFLISTEACVKSHGWDYFALPEECRSRERLSTNNSYLERCSKRSQLWHKLAVYAYLLGFIMVLLGLSSALHPTCSTLSLILLVYLIVSLLVRVACWKYPDFCERVASVLQKILKVA